jgi:hypothetical protein
MNTPFRLINKTERQALCAQFNEVMHTWSVQHCIHHLNASIILPSKEYHADYAYVITHNNNPLALLEAHCLHFFNEVLFGEHLSVFNSYSQKLIIELISALLKTPHELLMSPTEYPFDDWIYPGTTALMLSLHTHDKSLKLLLHPKWVYEQLPPLDKNTSKIETLNDALAPKTIVLDVELEALSLKLNQCMALKVGDVLVSDHVITAPMYLKHHKTLMCEVELGQSHSYKNIILKRSL